MPFPLFQPVRSASRHRAWVSVAATAMAALAPVTAISPALAAQPPPATPPGGAATAAAADPMTVLVQINDLGLLKALVPLRLTQEQTTRILALLRQVAEEGKKRAKQDEDELRAVGAEVARVRAAALAGTPVPAEFESRIQKMGQTAEARTKQAKSLAVGRILAELKTILTPEQRQLVVAQSVKVMGGRLIPAQYKDNPAKAPKEAVDDNMVGVFVDKVLLNERAITVLSEMKPPTSVSEGAQP